MTRKTKSTKASTTKITKGEKELAAKQRAARIAQGVDPSGAGNPAERPTGSAPDLTPDEIRALPRTSTKGQAKPKSAGPEPTEYSVLEWVSAYLAKDGTDSYTAPMDGVPFRKGGRVYFKAQPLAGFVLEQFGVEPKPGLLADELRKAGAKRSPFAFKLDGRQTCASHYSVGERKVTLPDGLAERKTAVEVRRESEPAPAKVAAKAKTKATARARKGGTKKR